MRDPTRRRPARCGPAFLTPLPLLRHGACLDGGGGGGGGGGWRRGCPMTRGFPPAAPLVSRPRRGGGAHSLPRRRPSPSPSAALHSLPDGEGHLYYDVAGPAGAPLILCIHGFMLDRRLFDDALSAGGEWGTLPPPLADAGVRIGRVDLRGHGQSSLPTRERPYSHAADVRSLAAVLSPDRPVHLVGVGAGGAVAINAAFVDVDAADAAAVAAATPAAAAATEGAAPAVSPPPLPPRVASLFLLSPSVDGFGWSRGAHTRVETDAILADVPAAVADWASRPPLVETVAAGGAPAAAVAAMLADYSGYHLVFGDPWQARPEMPAAGRLEKLAGRLPAAVWVGAGVEVAAGKGRNAGGGHTRRRDSGGRSHRHGPDDWRRAAEFVRASLGAEGGTVPGAAHLLPLEAPDWFVAELAAWVAKVEAAGVPVGGENGNRALGA